MGLAKSAMIFWSLMMMMALCGVSMAANHKVGGDSAGWTAQAHVDYTKWASAKNFHVGDTLCFAYNSQFHDVLQVTQQDFQSSNATSPVATNISGSDSIKLKRCPYAHLFSLSAVTAPTPTPSNAPVLHSSKLGFAVTVLAVLLIKLKQ